MTAIINASTSAGITQTGDNSGVLAIQSAGTTVATFNSSGVNAGIQVASNAAPAFSAYKSASSQSISSGVFTKVTFDVKEFDTNTNFGSNTTFTPTVAGYYQVTACASASATGATIYITSIYKNGSEYKRGLDIRGLTTTQDQVLNTALVFCNGSTDYIEIYCYNNGVTPSIGTGSTATYFQAVFVRSA